MMPQLTKQRAAELINAMRDRKIVVLGDVMLDSRFVPAGPAGNDEARDFDAARRAVDQEFHAVPFYRWDTAQLDRVCSCCAAGVDSFPVRI